MIATIPPRRIGRDAAVFALARHSTMISAGTSVMTSQTPKGTMTRLAANLGPDTTSRANGSVGGEITKRLVQMAEQQLGGTFR